MNRASGVHPRFHSSIHRLLPAVTLQDVSSRPSTHSRPAFRSPHFRPPSNGRTIRLTWIEEGRSLEDRYTVRFL
jgi:hypothetical protein